MPSTVSHLILSLSEKRNPHVCINDALRVLDACVMSLLFEEDSPENGAAVIDLICVAGLVKESMCDYHTARRYVAAMAGCAT